MIDEEQRRDWAEADGVFERLLDLEPAARVAAFAALDLSAAVRRRVERLLAADAAPTALDRPLRIEAGSEPRNEQSESRLIGRWRLGAEIGRGGSAVVYLAEADDQPGRRAALKLLGVGAIVGEGLERFRREQAILARLSHPHIAALYEAGISADGTPWLAMALVDGVRIDAWCRGQDLDVAARIRLLLDVCDALSHAHQALVIHRDIKPGNVLVDASGHVRLLDFGIARLGDASDGERTATEYRALTPDYAAPEQFAGAPPSTAMDVWGLGALAYQLLTGRPPRAEAAVEGSLIEPSCAISAGHFGDATRTGRARRAQAGDLDAIVLKALAAEPQARYASVALLAEDLRRWLDGQPVSAQAPTLRYRAGRFLRRHRGAVAAVFITVLAVMGGLAMALWQAQRAELAAAQARVEAARAEAAYAEAQVQLRRADALREFLMRLFAVADRDRASAALPTIAEVLERGASEARASSALEPAARADLLATLGRLYAIAGRPEQARPLLDEAIAQARAAGAGATLELARALLWRGLAGADRDDRAVAEAPFTEAASLLAERLPQASLRVEVLLAWARTRVFEFDVDGAQQLLAPFIDGRWDGAPPTAAQQLALLEAQGQIETRQNRLDAARQTYARVLEARRASDPGTRALAIALASAAGVDFRLGLLVEAESRIRESLAIYAAIGEWPSQYAGSARIRHGQVLEAMGRFKEAGAAYDAGNLEWAALRGMELERYAYAWSARGLLAATALDDAAAGAALARFLRLAEESALDIRGDRALVEAELAAASCAQGDTQAAERLALARAALAEGAHDPVRASHAIALAEARCALTAGDPAAALAALDAAVAAAPPAAGTEARDARAALTRIAALRWAGHANAAQTLAQAAIERLGAAGLAEHPYRARLEAAAKD